MFPSWTPKVPVAILALRADMVEKSKKEIRWS